MERNKRTKLALVIAGLGFAVLMTLVMGFIMRHGTDMLGGVTTVNSGSWRQLTERSSTNYWRGSFASWRGHRERRVWLEPGAYRVDVDFAIADGTFTFTASSGDGTLFHADEAGEHSFHTYLAERTRIAFRFEGRGDTGSFNIRWQRE